MQQQPAITTHAGPINRLCSPQLEVSTVHLTPEEAAWFAEGGNIGPCMSLMSCPYGSLVSVQDDVIDQSNPEPSEGLQGIVELARANHIGRILFDRDAEKVASVREYDW